MRLRQKTEKSDNLCRNCDSKDTEALFCFPRTFFWYGATNDFLEENIEPKHMDASIQFCHRCGFMGIAVHDALRNILDVFYHSPYSVTGATSGQKGDYSRRLADDFFKIYSCVAGNWVPERILEVGCQEGFLLYEFQKRGTKKVVGIEPGDVQPCLDYEGKPMDIRRGILSREIIAERDFDFIFALHALEHVEQVKEFLEIIYDLLKPDGLLLIAVPNELFSLQEGNIGMFLFQHLNYFTPGLLSSLLLDCGFQIKNIISRRDESLYILAQKDGDRDNKNINCKTKENIYELLKGYTKKVNEKLTLVRDISRMTPDKPLGFYGVAGAVNIFSWLPELWERGCAIFDSDSSTWGARFGGIPGRVYSPEELNRVRDIIVVPFRLQEEILRLKFIDFIKDPQ